MSLGSVERGGRADPSDDDVQFEAFLGSQRDVLVGMLRRRGASEQDAQDIAQESLVRLVRYRSRPREAWAPLLVRIAINAFNDGLRRGRSRQDAQHVSLDEEAIELACPAPAHEERVATEQELVRLQQALLRLPQGCREVYLLNRIEGMSYTEIARHRGVSVKAVEKQISKALALLRRALTDPQGAR